jgi:GT2 family glycosyltransferase
LKAKTDYPFVSVIILNFNGEDYLANCIASVLKNRYSNFEVILVDNASTDSSLKLAQEAFGADPRLRIIKNDANLGFSGGNNIGFNYAKGDYIVLLNNDTIVDSDWLAALVSAMQNDSTIGLAQSMILMIDGEKIQTAGWLFSNYLVQKHALAENKNSNTKFSSIFEVSVASGASMITRRTLLDEIGLFDSKIPFFYDDTLLSFKVWLADKRVVTVPNSKIRHIQGATSAWNVELTTFNLLKAKICLTFDVYYRLDELARAAFTNFSYTTINSLFALKRKNIAVISANVHGFAWGLSNFRYLWQNRLNHWSKTKISPEKLKEKFVRVKLPVPFYLVSSKLGNDCFAFEVEKYENTLIHE